MARRSVADIEKIWSNVEGVKKLSDRAVGIGPFGIGLDGLLTWVPVVGTVYSLGAAGWLLVQGIRARALQKDIETTHWVEANEREARAGGAHEGHVADMRRNPKLRRIVYLHD